ncbi:MAG: formyltetrahydrofolate deformylase [Cyclobacteriaceae bacterium]|nr:formyltetrahydrofolate deformylase [Cyclobacteriaceae bacterium]
MNAGILLIHCPDQPGLVYKITQVIYRHQLNIISNGEFVDRNFNHFFMRTEFSGIYNREVLFQELKETLPAEVVIKLSTKQKRDICILVTKEHHCLSDLLIRNSFNELDVNLKCVVSNHQNLEGLVHKFEIPFHFITHANKDREAHEAEVLSVIQRYNPEFIVLAKYMRVLSTNFVEKFSNHIINIHHSFLPAFVGANPYAQAYDRGVKIIGATAHFVNNSLDEGPIIAQSVIPVAHTHSAREMAQAGKDVEKIVLARSLKLVLSDRVFVYRNRTIIFD